MKREFLEDLKLEKEMIDKIMAENGKDIESEKQKVIAKQTELDSLNDTKKDLEQQIKDRDKQLKELQDKAKGNEELEKTIKDLQDTNKATKDQYEAKIKEMTISTAIQAKLSDTKYPDLLLTKFDRTKLVVNADGTVTGIDEQLTGIKETYKDLFVPAVTGREPNNNGDTPTGGKNPWSKEHFNLTEQGKLLRENPELAKQFMAGSK